MEGSEGPPEWPQGGPAVPVDIPYLNPYTKLHNYLPTNTSFITSIYFFALSPNISQQAMLNFLWTRKNRIIERKPYNTITIFNYKK